MHARWSASAGELHRAKPSARSSQVRAGFTLGGTFRLAVRVAAVVVPERPRAAVVAGGGVVAAEAFAVAPRVGLTPRRVAGVPAPFARPGVGVAKGVLGAPRPGVTVAPGGWAADDGAAPRDVVPLAPGPEAPRGAADPVAGPTALRLSAAGAATSTSPP